MARPSPPRTIPARSRSGIVALGGLRQLRGHNRLVSSIAFSPDGTKLASASWDSTVVVWDLAGSRAMTRLQGHMRSVLSVAFSPDGRRLATSSEDQTVRLWDVETGQEVLTLHGHTDIVPTVAFSPDGNRLATAGADGIVLVREAGPAYGTRPASPWGSAGAIHRASRLVPPDNSKTRRRRRTGLNSRHIEGSFLPTP